ncbi:MAG TPA: hypothetical protein VF132_08735 [Rudaea sp.]
MFARAIVAAVLLSASTLHATNAVQNPNFTGGISGWSASSVGGGAYYESYFGSPVGGALRLDTNSFNATAQGTQCVDLHKFVTMNAIALDFSLRYAINGQSGTGTHQFKLEVYDQAGCAGNLLTTLVPDEAQAIAVDGIGAGWKEAGQYGTAYPPGALSALVSVQTASGSAGVANFMIDDVYVGPLDVIFADDLEP